MREIKFRAWDNDAKQMIYSGFYIEQLSGKCYWAWEDTAPFDKKGIESCGELEPELMQWTGYLDKTKQEIYEDDILLDTLTGVEYQIKFGFCKKYAYTGWYCWNEELERAATLNGDYDTNINSQVIVIGNIYQKK